MLWDMCSTPGFAVAWLIRGVVTSRTHRNTLVHGRNTIMLAGQQTHMWKEIQEQPAALRRTLDNTAASARQVAFEAQQRNVDLVLLAARGTSDHAALYAQYLFQYLNGIPVALATPSLYTLYGTSLHLGRGAIERSEEHTSEL